MSLSDQVVARVEPERVQAVLDDGTKPTMAVRLADGSRIRVTPTHPFYADWGPDLRNPGWLEAGQLRAGDRLRTADGRGTTVAGLEYDTGSAHVYTLTVATDHTFFVAAAQVLVHNSGPCPDVVGLLLPEGKAIGVQGSSSDIREVAGGTPVAQQLFDLLSAGGTDVTPAGFGGQAGGKLVSLSGGITIGIRYLSKSGDTAIDIQGPTGLPFTKIHFGR